MAWKGHHIRYDQSLHPLGRCPADTAPDRYACAGRRPLEWPQDEFPFLHQVKPDP
ncbi:MAG: hypothetical protein RLZZ165_750 [Bacteroidota bacterium]